MVRKRIRNNYYKKGRARRKERILRLCVLSIKTVLLLAGIGVTSLLFILAHDALMQSSFFDARQITVEGAHRLSREAILRQAEVKLGDNILGVNLRIVRYRLLANPWIADADVRRRLPDGIHIRITERVPIAKIEFNQPFYLDDSGDIVKPVEPSDQIRVPVVTGLKLSDIRPDKPEHPKLFKAVKEVLHLSRAHGSVLPLDVLHCIHIDPDSGLTIFVFDSHLAIKLGFGDYESKFNRLRDVISYFGEGEQLKNVEYIYLNDVERVVVRYSGGVSALKVCYRKEV